MRQTVVGVFDSYAGACAAQQALTEGGFSQADISIYAMSIDASAIKGPRVYVAGGADVRHSRSTPVFDQLEQLFARLFQPGSYPPETEDYREVIRRGGAILSADVSDVQVDLACDVMRRAGATDIGERTKSWRTGAGEQAKKEPIRGSVGVHVPSSAHSSEQHEPTDLRRSAPSAGSPVAGRTTIGGETLTTGGNSAQRTDFSEGKQRASGVMQQVSPRTEVRPLEPEPESAPVPPRQSSPPPSGAIPSGAPSSRAAAGTAAGSQTGREPPREDRASAGPAERKTQTSQIGDPIMGMPLSDDASYEDGLRRDRQTRAESGAAEEEYQRAYTHGATLRQDERYRAREWQEVEPSARAQWESRYPESAWERFKAAVRHGWERINEKR